jgi:hypothetical protein
MGKKSGSGSWKNNPDHISESLETIFGLEFSNADPGSGMGKIRIRMEKIRIQDKHLGSAILRLTSLFVSLL